MNKPETSKDDIQLLLNRGRELTATNPAKAAFMFEEAFHHAAEKNNYALAGESGKELSAVYFELNEFKKSLSVLQQSISFFEKLKDNDNIIACYEGCIQLHLAHHDYLNVLEILHKCCTIFKEQNKILTLAETYNRIGEIYKLLAEYRNAINYHERALQVFEQANKQEQLSLTYYYIGNCYNWADELDVSYNFLLKSLKIADQLHQPELKLKSLGSLAVLFTKYKDYSRSSDYFFEAIDNANLTGNKQFKSILLKSLGNLYNQMNEPEKAIKVLTEGLEITRELELKIPTDLIHQFLSDSYVMTGDYKKAFEHFKLFQQLNSEIQNEEVNIKTRGLELKYDLEEIKKEKLAAEKSIVLKDKFLAGITHELRTPLNGIVGLADVLSDSAVTPEQREYVSTIRNSAYNILSVINDLLDYARLNTQQIKAEEVVFDFLQLVDSLSKNFPAGKLIISVPDQKLAVKRNLIADKNIIYKLISHILDYAHTNNTAGDISLSYELHNTGRIPLLNFKIFFSPRHSASQMASIFEIQVDEQYTASAKANTGLGLNIARQFASLINGSISFIDDNSESFFSVTLPVKIADKIITLHDDGIKQDEKKADHLYKILLVEDNKVNQFLAKTMLVKSGFYVDVATDGNDAIEKLSQTGYDFVLTDVQMPGMNGYDLARYIRSKFTKPLCDIPIIALTAYESAIEKDKAKESGMTDYLTKPYNLNDLVTVIQKYKNKPSKTSGTSDEIISIEQTVSHLEGLVLNSKKDLRNLIEMLCEQIPQLTDEIEAAVKIKDWDAVFKAAHKLKSSVNLLEVKTLNEAIETIETNAMKKINTDDIASLLKNFKDNSSKVVKLLKTYR